MNLNICFNTREKLPGYITIDPFNDGTGNEGIVNADIYCFDRLCLDGEAQSIRAVGVLEYFQAAVADKIFGYWLKKLAYGGTITIGGVEPYLLSKRLVTRAISIADYNEIMFGMQRFPWEYKKAVVDIVNTDRYLKGKGLQVVSKEIYDDYKYIITAKKILK